MSSGDLLRSISLTVKSGEVIGLAGVLGSGRNELCEALYGLRQISPDTTIQLNAQRAQFDEPKKASRHGIFLLSEDRKQEGIFPGLDLRENTILRTMVGRRSSARSARPRNTGLMEITGFGVVSTRSELIAFDEMRRSLNIKCSGPESRITHLSGGNQQKILFARGRISKPFLMILSEPTRGVDIGAKEEIYSAIDQLASEGTGLIVSSSEIPELLRLCTRILVLRHGEVVAEVLSLQANEESILKIMAG